MRAIRQVYEPVSKSDPRRVTLRRRGVNHGTYRPKGRATEVDLRDAWAEAAPLHLPGALGPAADWQLAVRRTSRLFTRLLDDADFEADVARRLADRPEWELAGASVDLSDPREIVKVHVDRRKGTRFDARDLWAKASWISHDPRDVSLRIRFSFGSEYHDDWQHDPKRARAADDLAEAVFPECARLARNPALDALLRKLTGRRVRLSERIVFANAPGGGARFHHDAEPDQLGVAYGQMEGRTAWLAVPKRELAVLAGRVARGPLARSFATERRALAALDREDDALRRLLDSTPRLTRTLAEHGRLHVLRPGDVLLLPSRGADEAAWHSVFALGDRPSLAHSYGIFAAR
ncbi:MAG: hypothetical protein R3B81_02345 [bacterium]